MALTLLSFLYYRVDTPRHYNFVLCSKMTKPRDRRSLNGDGNRGLRKLLDKNFLITVKDGDVTCNKCRQLYYTHKSVEVPCLKTVKERPKAKQKSNENKTSPPRIELPISTIGGSHSQCFICKRRGPKLVVVPAAARNEMFLERNVLISSGSRCCPVHLEEGSFTEKSCIVV